MVNLRGCPSELEKARAAGDFTLVEYAGEQTGQSYGQWTDLKWLKSFTKLPIVLKGVISGKLAQYKFCIINPVVDNAPDSSVALNHLP